MHEGVPAAGRTFVVGSAGMDQKERDIGSNRGNRQPECGTLDRLGPATTTAKQ